MTTSIQKWGNRLFGGLFGTTKLGGPPAAIYEDVWLPTICQICNRGPECILVHRVNGVIVGMEGNYNFPQQQSCGRVCPKPFSMIQKSYYPYRVKAPLKRTNPEKGIGVDPKWVEISWDEALNTVGGWLKKAIEDAAAAREKGEYANIGYGAASGGGGGSAGTWLEFIAALRQYVNVDPTVRGGGGVHCTMAEHVFCHKIHNSGAGYTDLTYCNWVMHFRNFLAQSGARSAAAGGWAEARERGMKIIRCDPYAPVSQAYTDEWYPVKPKTETALFMAMAYVIVHELGTWDVPFVKNLTNSPYLVGPGGHFMRHSETKKPLVWDAVENRAKEYDDTTVKDLAIEGTYTVSGLEVNGLDEEIVRQDVAARPAFQVLKDHLRQFTPEWAAPICDGISAEGIRHLAKEFVEHVQIGATIEIEGVTLPLRPASITASRGFNTGFGSAHAVFAMHLVLMLVGAIEVPGCHGGGRQQKPGKDGFPFMEVTKWEWPPKEFGALPLVPVVGGLHETNHPLGHYFLANPGMVAMPKPLGFIVFAGNPLLSLYDHKVVEASIKSFPWAWGVAYTINETNSLCDILLPENVDLERSQIVQMGTANPESKHIWEGIAIRQEIIESPVDSRELADICTELADRAGILAAYNQQINSGTAREAGERGVPELRDPYKLPDLNQKYSWEDILNRKYLSATNGEKDLEWFKKNGATFWRVPEWGKYRVHLDMVRQKLRYPLPYAEYVLNEGELLQKHLDENGIDWWDTNDYTALPEWQDQSQRLQYGGPEYNFYCLTVRVAQFAWGRNEQEPWYLELSEQVLGQSGVTMNADAAAALGIKNGDEVYIESPVGKSKGKVLLVQGLRPDCIVLSQQMGHWETPVAKDRGWPTLNTHLPAGPEWVEKVTGGIDNVAMVKVYKA